MRKLAELAGLKELAELMAEGRYVVDAYVVATEQTPVVQPRPPHRAARARKHDGTSY